MSCQREAGTTGSMNERLIRDSRTLCTGDRLCSRIWVGKIHRLSRLSRAKFHLAVVRFVCSLYSYNTVFERTSNYVTNLLFVPAQIQNHIKCTPFDYLLLLILIQYSFISIFLYCFIHSTTVQCMFSSQ